MGFTVGITNYNYRSSVQDAIASARGAEIIVVDNCSTDGSLDDLRATEGIILLEHESNTGTATVGCNEIIAAASGDWLVFLDADDVLLPDAFDTFAKYADGADWLVPDLAVFDAELDAYTTWDYEGYPLTRDDALLFVAKRRMVPVSMKGAFRVEWLRDNGLEWSEFPHTYHSADCCTCLKWLETRPRIRYIPTPCVRYTWRRGNLPDEHRELMVKDIEDYLRGLCERV